MNGGRRPEPVALRVLASPSGKPPRDRSKSAGSGDMVLALPVQGRPNYPMSLKPSGRGRRYWRLYWEKAPWLAAADYPMVLRLCELWDIYDSLRARVLEDGLGEPYYQTNTKRRTSAREEAPYRIHPMWQTVMNMLRDMERLESLLGLNPVERSRIRVSSGTEESSLESWQRARQERQSTRPAPATSS